MKQLVKNLVKLLSPILCGLFLCAVILGYLTPDALTTTTPDSAFVNGSFPLSLRYDHETAVTASASDHDQPTLKAQLMLLGFFPVKEVSVTLSEHREVYLGGQAFGLRLYTDGLVVSSVSEVPTQTDMVSPAADAGIEQGDILLSVNGEPLRTNEQLLDTVTRRKAPLLLRVKRDERTFSTTITPAYDIHTKSDKLGLHVRDSIAGIGTLTFIDPSNKSFAGLGHGICDAASGCLMPLLDGDIVPISIQSVVKSLGGHPGTLCGSFADNTPQGTLSLNSDHGVYGHVNVLPTDQELIPVAFRQETVQGSAQLICTVDESAVPCAYDIEIEDISYNNRQTVKNMVVRITDERLLRQTGGIVQGMSGSPIVQNGQLVGALTHVFINDPTHGYAVFAENMTDFTDQLAVGTSP